MTLVFVFLLYPTILNYTLEMFNCIEINEERFLQSNFDMVCWGRTHILQIVFIAIPVTIIWILGFPLFIFRILYKNRDNLSDKDLIIKYGLFYIGLTDKAFWWELIAVNLRKLVFVGATLAAYSYSANMQGLIAFLVIFINHFFLKYIKPYNKPYLNNLDILGSLISQLTILSGMFFL